MDIDYLKDAIHQNELAQKKDKKKLIYRMDC